MALEVFGSQFYATALFALNAPGGAILQFSLHLEGTPNTTLGTEISAGGYARVSVSTATSLANWTLPSGASAREVTNAKTITFPTSTANWGTIYAVGFWKPNPNASGTQTLFDWTALTNPITVGANETLSMAPTRFSYQIG